MKTLLGIALALCTALPLTGCTTTAQHRAVVQDDSSERLTVGTVQRKVRVGMPGSEVASVLGSPNIVTTDEKRREVWVYDKIATEHAFSTSEGGVSVLILGGGLVGGLVGGAVAPRYWESAGASSTSQRTLTVIIRFDEEMKVRDFAYHTSRF